MKEPQTTSPQIARLFVGVDGCHTIRHKNGNTIYEDRTGAIHAPGIFHSRDQLERAMFHPEHPLAVQQFDAV